MINRFIAFVFGLILLAPGACALGFMGLSLQQFADPKAPDRAFVIGFWPVALVLWAICFAISYGGIRVIRAAFKG